jgi:hypothetical protein
MVPDHIHHEDSGSVKSIDDSFGRNADSRDEEFRAVADGHVD